MKYLVCLFFLASVSARFTDDVYQILAKENAEQNIISSPLSLEIVMAMVYMGAKGNTAKELQTVLKLPEDRNQVAKKYREFFTNLEGREKDAILELANRIYINDQLRLLPEYNKIVGDSFKAEAVPINVGNPQSAAATINSWVSRQTRNKITKIVSAESINRDFMAIIINAIYFKGVWKYKFVKEDTRKKDFHTSSNEKIPVDMMYLEGSFLADHFSDLDAKVLELPYRNSKLFMQIFLPNRIDGLSKLESQIGGFSRPLRKQDVYVRIPKFKIEFEKSLDGLLAKLGIKAAFSGAANFSGLVKDNLQISKVLQKGFVEVNEEGAEAAVVTAFNFIKICSHCPDNGPHPMIFTANHPFAFLIRDRETIYFQGHIVRP
ncbi:serine protease inhibitor 42Dd isoform X1 [Drosophila bipectinata]|uniref:serine protease inhibitor 42Dd isoform X1 n=1 Tax=Drosophila bipectinata TaxID=42026 RepID=UPI001C8A46FE|nr:serine protease inhibitor 42Dd isoform X1 [Drosophila bipectinata]